MLLCSHGSVDRGAVPTPVADVPALVHDNGVLVETCRQLTATLDQFNFWLTLYICAVFVRNSSIREVIDHLMASTSDILGARGISGSGTSAAGAHAGHRLSIRCLKLHIGLLGQQPVIGLMLVIHFEL